MGGSLALVGVLLGLPALPFALGIYLPLSTMASVFVGGWVRRLVEKRREGTFDVQAGVLCASGFVAGEGLAGVGIAGWAYIKDIGREPPLQGTALTSWSAIALLAVACFVLYRSCVKRASA
jgi:uncharacterized oligopeptide transporter (OPT) family protein